MGGIREGSKLWLNLLVLQREHDMMISETRKMRAWLVLMKAKKVTEDQNGKHSFLIWNMMTSTHLTVRVRFKVLCFCVFLDMS